MRFAGHPTDSVSRAPAYRVLAGGLVVAYLAAWAASQLVFHQTSDLDVFLWPAGETAAHGHPLLIYSANTFGQGPNSSGPLALVPLLPVVIVANLMGWSSDIGLRTGVTVALFSIFALLLAAAAVRLVERARGGLEWRLAAPCVILLAPALWISVGGYGHIEQPIELWLVILAVGYVTKERAAAAGVALGLAVLTRSTAVLYIIPIALLPLATHRMKPTLTTLLVTVVVASAGFAPFFIADGASALHSLITFRSSAPIGGGSFWVVAFNTSWAEVAQRGDVYLVLAVAATLAVTMVRWRPDTARTVAGFFGLLTVVAICFPMLSSSAYAYYLLEPYVFGATWWLARPGSALNWRVAVPLLLTADALLAKAGATLPFNGLGVLEGVGSSVILAATIALVMSDILRSRAEPDTEPGVSPPAAPQRGQRAAG
jgi:hypothetical protein